MNVNVAIVQTIKYKTSYAEQVSEGSSELTSFPKARSQKQVGRSLKILKYCFTMMNMKNRIYNLPRQYSMYPRNNEVTNVWYSRYYSLKNTYFSFYILTLISQIFDKVFVRECYLYKKL